MKNKKKSGKANDINKQTVIIYSAPKSKTESMAHYAPESAWGAKGKKAKCKGSPYSITERRVPELIPVLGSQPAGDVSHKPGGRLPLLSARPAVTPATLKRVVTNSAAW